MRDPNQDDERRIRCAIALLPFCHARKGRETNKKDRQMEAAREAASKFSAGAPPAKVFSFPRRD
jgi:hypothetical protein